MHDNDIEKTDVQGTEKSRTKIWIICLTVLLAAVFIFCAVKLITRGVDTAKSTDTAEIARKAVTYVTPSPLPDSAGDAEAEDNAPLPEPPIEVDFRYLRRINKQVVGWLYCEDSAINFELMQADDNEYYLAHLIDKSYNQYGSVFADFRCASDFSDPNTLIYGHDMQNGSVFGGLELYSDQEYYDNHSVLYLITPDCSYRLEAVAGLLHTADHVMYNPPLSAEVTAKFVADAVEKSVFKPAYEVEEGDRFIILSTCSDEYQGARFALICRMVELP